MGALGNIETRMKTLSASGLPAPVIAAGGVLAVDRR